MLTFSVNPTTMETYMLTGELIEDFGVAKASEFLIDRMVSKGYLETDEFLYVDSKTNKSNDSKKRKHNSINTLDDEGQQSENLTLKGLQVPDFQDEVLDTELLNWYIEDFLSSPEFLRFKAYWAVNKKYVEEKTNPYGEVTVKKRQGRMVADNLAPGVSLSKHIFNKGASEVTSAVKLITDFFDTYEFDEDCKYKTPKLDANGKRMYTEPTYDANGIPDMTTVKVILQDVNICLNPDILQRFLVRMDSECISDT